MKYLLIILILAVLPALARAQSQDPLEVANSRIVTLLDLLDNQKAVNANLRKQIEELKQASLTPCAVSVQTTTARFYDLLTRLEKATPKSPVEKEIRAQMKSARKTDSRIIAAQCNISVKSGWGKVLDVLKATAPLALGVAVLVK